MIFYFRDKAFKGDYITFCNLLAICFIQQPISGQYHMLISSNLMVPVLHTVMWSIRKYVTHEAKEKNVHLFEPCWAKMSIPWNSGVYDFLKAHSKSRKHIT